MFKINTENNQQIVNRMRVCKVPVKDTSILKMKKDKFFLNDKEISSLFAVSLILDADHHIQ